MKDIVNMILQAKGPEKGQHEADGTVEGKGSDRLNTSRKNPASGHSPILDSFAMIRRLFPARH
ncbi:MAG TPA: hypothetical protein ENJ04_06515 [Nitrospirae bacterium]|nr:hypothetical protein [Nitrospirota bacterium]